MENKDIDKAAREYAECSTCKGCDTEESIKCGSYDGFISGAQSRQSEIDELIEAVEEMYKACSNIEAMNTHGNGKAALIRNYAQLWWPKATQLLEKYGKK